MTDFSSFQPDYLPSFIVPPSETGGTLVATALYHGR